MSVLDVLEKKAIERKDKVSAQGNNLNGGAVYEVEILSVRPGRGFSKKLNREAAFVTAELKILASDPKPSLTFPFIGKPANSAGSSASIPWCIEEDWAFDCLMRLLMGVTEESMDELVKEKKLENGTTQILYKHLLSDAQPLKGCRIMCESYDRALKGKEGSQNPTDYRARHKFSHTNATREATAAILAA